MIASVQYTFTANNAKPIDGPIVFFFIGKSRNYIKEGQKAALHTKGILSSPQGQKNKTKNTSPALKGPLPTPRSLEVKRTPLPYTT